MIELRKVSIIIPVYNAEQYLERCLNSVVKQSHDDLEIILVNDGSIDKSPEICEYYAKNDARIKVIHKKNAGPSLARRDGIESASGDYISFVDADDYIDVNMYKILFGEACKGADIVECGYREVSTDGELIQEYQLQSVTINETFECSLHYASQKNTKNFLWNKLYKIELLQNLNFPKLFAGEDSYILTQVFFKAKQVVNIKDALYNYVMTPNSLCRQPFSEKKMDNIEAGKFMYKFYSENLPELSGFSSLHICSYAAKLYCEIFYDNIDTKQNYLNYLVDNFNEYYNSSRNKSARSMSSKKRVIFVEIFRRSPRISLLVYKLFTKSA